jgi:CheY-like chemotaxis protein
MEKMNPSPRAQGNILVIEDDSDTADTIRTFLTDEGYHVRSVASRDNAQLVLNSYLYDVIVMDFMMPGLGAVEFMKEARRLCPRTAFVLTTAAPIAAERAKILGFTRWVGKPFTPEELVRTIRYCHL